MSNVYRPNRVPDYLEPFSICLRCQELEAENQRFRSELEAQRIVARLFNRAVLADFEFRGFPDADRYLGELFIAQVKREADYGY